jgi:hypothetical protein
VRAHLRSRLARLLISPCLLLEADDLAPLSIARDWRGAFAFCLIRLLESGLHVAGKGQLPYEWQKPFTAKDGAEDLLGVDEAAFGSALLWPKFVVLVPKCGVGECLVGDSDRFKAFFRTRIIAVLVGVVFDRKAACT